MYEESPIPTERVTVNSNLHDILLHIMVIPYSLYLFK